MADFGTCADRLAAAGRVGGGRDRRAAAQILKAPHVDHRDQHMRVTLCALFALLSAPAMADDSYTIKIKVDPDVGKTVHITRPAAPTGVDEVL